MLVPAIFKGDFLTIVVNVKDNNVEQALRSLKKKMQREGLYKEMKLRKHYEKPSLKRAREKEESIRRVRKLNRRKNPFISKCKNVFP